MAILRATAGSSGRVAASSSLFSPCASSSGRSLPTRYRGAICSVARARLQGRSGRSASWSLSSRGGRRRAGLRRGPPLRPSRRRRFRHRKRSPSPFRSDSRSHGKTARRRSGRWCPSAGPRRTERRRRRPSGTRSIRCAPPTDRPRLLRRRPRSRRRRCSRRNRHGSSSSRRPSRLPGGPRRLPRTCTPRCRRRLPQPLIMRPLRPYPRPRFRFAARRRAGTTTFPRCGPYRRLLSRSRTRCVAAAVSAAGSSP